MIHPPPRSPLFPYTTLFRSLRLWDRATGKELRRFATPAPKDPPAALPGGRGGWVAETRGPTAVALARDRSEEHTSELQSHSDLVCRLLLEKKKKHARKER